MKLLCCVFWLRAFVTVPFEYAHFMWGEKEKKKSFNRQQQAVLLEFFALLSSASRFPRCMKLPPQLAAFCQKDCVAPLKSSPTAKSHGGTFCLVLLHLHSSLPPAPRSQPVCCQTPQLVIVSYRWSQIAAPSFTAISP